MLSIYIALVANDNIHGVVFTAVGHRFALAAIRGLCPGHRLCMSMLATENIFCPCIMYYIHITCGCFRCSDGYRCIRRALNVHMAYSHAHMK